MATRRWLRLAGAGAWLSTGGVVATWACCSLPIAAGALGVGFGALGAALTPWRGYLISLGLVLASIPLIAAYWPWPRAGAGCALPRARRGRQRMLAWALFAATVAATTLPLWQLLVLNL